MVDYLKIALTCVVRESGLYGSAVDRIRINTDLRCDPFTARCAISQIKNALGSSKFQKATRKSAKWVIQLLEAHAAKEEECQKEPEPDLVKMSS